MSETMAELSLTLSERHTADFEMIGNGGFAPLTGFQGSADWERVCSEMRTADGAYWPIPITLASDLDCAVGDVVALSSDEGKPLGSLTVEEIFERDTRREAEQVYGTTDEAHPGVAAIYEEGARCLAGPIEEQRAPLQHRLPVERRREHTEKLRGDHRVEHHGQPPALGLTRPEQPQRCAVARLADPAIGSTVKPMRRKPPAPIPSSSRAVCSISPPGRCCAKSCSGRRPMSSASAWYFPYDPTVAMTTHAVSLPCSRRRIATTACLLAASARWRESGRGCTCTPRWV